MLKRPREAMAHLPAAAIALSGFFSLGKYFSTQMAPKIDSSLASCGKLI